MQNKTKKKTFYITTPIFYPSGNLHLGHLFTSSFAQVLCNYKKKQGYETLFLTGSDEHGQKIEEKAKELKIKPIDYVNQQYENFKNFFQSFNIKYDVFSRTTNLHHQKVVAKIFELFLEKGYIYEGEYEGLYSISDEEFVPLNQVVKKDGSFFHPVSGAKLQKIKEKTYFFKMSLFVPWLLTYFKDHNYFIIPKKILKELENNFLNEGLEDLSITRVNFTWGINVISNPKHVIYVWLDALCNYITNIGFDFNSSSEQFNKFWTNGDEIVHIIGKEISRFHCIYWPIFLKALELREPSHILAHGWLVTPEGKMSKSKGNVINPLDLLNSFEPEIIKWFLVVANSFENDTIFSEELLKLKYNSDLVNTIGNLINRTFSMWEQNFSSNDHQINFSNKKLNNLDLSTLNLITKAKNKYLEKMDQFHLNEAFDILLNLARDLNKYIDLTLPWTLKNNLEELEKILLILLNGSYAICTFLDPFIPSFINEYKLIFNINDFDFNLIDNFDKFNNNVFNKNKIIFKRK